MDTNMPNDDIKTAQDVMNERIQKWGYLAARLRADIAILQAAAVQIELGIMETDPSWEVSKVHEATNSIKNIMR